jgi:hypothetical protein
MINMVIGIKKTAYTTTPVTPPASAPFFEFRISNFLCNPEEKQKTAPIKAAVTIWAIIPKTVAATPARPIGIPTIL